MPIFFVRTHAAEPPAWRFAYQNGARISWWSDWRSGRSVACARFMRDPCEHAILPVCVRHPRPKCFKRKHLIIPGEEDSLGTGKTASCTTPTQRPASPLTAGPSRPTVVIVFLFKRLLGTLSLSQAAAMLGGGGGATAACCDLCAVWGKESKYSG